MDFKPFPFLSGAHQQTCLGWALNFPTKLLSVTETVLLSDNDQIACEVTTPKGWLSTDHTVVVIHGLCGSHESPFVVRIGKRLADSGVKVVRMNMRGCGSGAGLARKVYHCGRSEDLLPVLKQYKAQAPNSPLTVVGFSLGGNIALKCAGESPVDFADLVDQVIGICPATDILASTRLLGLPENRIYERHFVEELREQLKSRERFFPDIPPDNLPKKFNLFEFDELYTAPQCGFRSALDYYRQASASRVIANIKVPTNILFAADDPFIDWTALNGLSLPKNLRVHLTRHGGHLGFIGHPSQPGGCRWMDHLVVNWVTRGSPPSIL